MKQLLAAALACLASTTSIGQASEAGFVPLFADNNFQDWEFERLPRAAASAANGSVHLAPGSGWLATRKLFTDFILRVDVRARTGFPSFTVLVRAIPDPGKPTPRRAYGIRFQDRRAVVVAMETETREVPFERNGVAQQLNESVDWQAIELSCRGRTCTLSVNDGEVARVENLEMPLGRIGLMAGGDVELRDMRVRRLAPIAEGFAKGAYLIDDDPDMKLPRLVRETKPKYTPQAMRAKIQGAVLLAVVVKEDGTLGDLAMLRSLDPVFGLDREAIDAARQWRFEPATLRGTRVPALVTIELSFTLKP